MGSDKPSGADNQQGSRRASAQGELLTPQRLHAELLAASAKSLEEYLQGALRDGYFNRHHRTHRFSQSSRKWLETLQTILDHLGHKSWIYKEGKNRRVWALETSASFLDVGYEPDSESSEALSYVRGFFDAEGGMPQSPNARLYFQFTQKDRPILEALKGILKREGITTGRIHNPSRRVDPEYWRFYVNARSHQEFMRTVGSWHPRKRRQMRTRMKI